MTLTEKRIEMVKRLVELRRNDEIGGQLERPGDTILRALRASALALPPCDTVNQND